MPKLSRRSILLALLIIGVVISLPYFALPWYVRSGATPEERASPLPGDMVVQTSRTGYTLATTVEAPPEVVWLWLLQMGQGRAGFYTHVWVENLLGAKIRNANEVIAAFQHLEVGDTVRLTPDPYLGRPGQYMTVVELEAPRSLVYRQVMPNGSLGSWAFSLQRTGPNRTRLVMRRRGERPSLFDRVMMPGYVFMDRGVLAGIRARVRARPGSRIEDSSFLNCATCRRALGAA